MAQVMQRVLCRVGTDVRFEQSAFRDVKLHVDVRQTGLADGDQGARRIRCDRLKVRELFDDYQAVLVFVARCVGRRGIVAGRGV